MSGLIKRPCPVPFCANSARATHLMCRTCWAMVPEPKRKQVNRAFGSVRAAMRDRPPPQEIRARVAAYQRASDVAIAAVQRSRP